MNYQQTIQRLTGELTHTFDVLDAFFDLSEEQRCYKPAAEEWSIDEILEHVTLTNHFLLVTLNQSLTKVLRRAQTQALPDGESDLDIIVQISDPDAFGWIRPEHMEPKRDKPSSAIRLILHDQRDECLKIVRTIPNGEGALHTVRMSVRNLGRLDMYQWMYFLVQHARRHVTEMTRIMATENH